MMKEEKIGVYTKGAESYNFKFCTDLKVSEKAKFVNSVASLVVSDKSYNSVIRDIVFDFYIIDMMTDVDTNELKESSFFVNDVEEFLYNTNIVDIVKANAFPSLFDELNKAVDDSIEYLTGIHKNPINDALVSLISTIERKINAFDMSEAMDMANKFIGMTDEFTIENVVKAYMNSDIHKKNLEEIEKV